MRSKDWGRVLAAMAAGIRTGTTHVAVQALSEALEAGSAECMRIHAEDHPPFRLTVEGTGGPR